MESNDLVELARGLLARANADRKSPFKTFVLASAGDGADARIVVNRSFNPKDWSLVFYTDSRSPKISALQKSDQVCSLFWDKKQSLQIRLYSKATILSTKDELFQKHLHKVQSGKQQQDYQTVLPPGSLLGNKAEPEYDTSELNLSVIELKSFKADILKLDREGHSRCMVYIDGEEMRTQKLVP